MSSDSEDDSWLVGTKKQPEALAAHGAAQSGSGSGGSGGCSSTASAVASPTVSLEVEQFVRDMDRQFVQDMQRAERRRENAERMVNERYERAEADKCDGCRAQGYSGLLCNRSQKQKSKRALCWRSYERRVREREMERERERKRKRERGSGSGSESSD